MIRAILDGVTPLMPPEVQKEALNMRRDWQIKILFFDHLQHPHNRSKRKKVVAELSKKPSVIIKEHGDCFIKEMEKEMDMKVQVQPLQC